MAAGKSRVIAAGTAAEPVMWWLTYGDLLASSEVSMSEAPPIEVGNECISLNSYFPSTVVDVAL